MAPLAFFSTALPYSLPRVTIFLAVWPTIFFSAGASEHVNSFSLVWVFLSPVVCTEDTFQFTNTFESHIKASFLGRAFEGVRDGWDVHFYLKNFFVGERLS